MLQREWEPKAAEHLGSEQALAEYHMQVTLALKAVEDDIQSKFRVEQRDVAQATVRRGSGLLRLLSWATPAVAGPCTAVLRLGARLPAATLMFMAAIILSSCCPLCR